ncbi:hypothetical protein P4O66_003463 [Electrophorus voltai]|uniref:Uncharacterized protein n=1 Tax=Electrophorus voltai TaxID=2609070 RepID=A0AAD8YQ93_9TELE|nr:hypothetical protein P4O66_003463 [Electrophorus voltai]
MAASRERSGCVGVLYGEFTDAADWQVRYSVSLTDSCLTVQQITSSPSRDELALSLGDCVGSRAHRERNGADQGACFSAYFYPNVPRRRSSGTARQRVERCFRVALAEDARANLAEAERWARAVRQRASRHSGRSEGEESLSTMSLHKGKTFSFAHSDTAHIAAVQAYPGFRCATGSHCPVRGTLGAFGGDSCPSNQLDLLEWIVIVVLL